jgi:hypothetical protein
MSTVIKDPFMDRLIAKGEATGIAKGEAKGKVAGEAKLLLRYLDSRFNLPEQRRKQIEDCSDAHWIEAWFDRALTATTLDQVFAA